MSKITYHKYCRHHAGVKKVTREFNKLLSQCRYFEPFCTIEFTGVADEDLFNLNYYISNNYNDLNKKLTEEIKIHQADLQSEYSTNRFFDTMKFIAGIEKIKGIIYNDYPGEIFEYILKFSNPEASVEEKKWEYASHFKASPLIGFRKAFFAYRGENKRQIWPLTVSPEDLEGVDKILIQYQ